MSTRIEAFINPEVLRWARESINMSPADAAARIAVKQDRLIDWEDGIERPSLQQLRKCSEVYKRPLAVFYLPEPPKGFRVPKDFRRLPETQRGDLPPEFLIELRRMSYQRTVAIELAEEAGEVTDSPVRTLLGSISVDADAAAVAVKIRDMLGVTLEQQAEAVRRLLSGK